MIIELFVNTLSKKDQLYHWLQQKGFAYTHEVQQWGLDNHHIRAERDCREMAEEKKLRRLTEEEKMFRNFTHKDWVWTTEGCDCV